MKETIEKKTIANGGESFRAAINGLRQLARDYTVINGQAVRRTELLSDREAVAEQAKSYQPETAYVHYQPGERFRAAIDALRELARDYVVVRGQAIHRDTLASDR